MRVCECVFVLVCVKKGKNCQKDNFDSFKIVQMSYSLYITEINNTLSTLSLSNYRVVSIALSDGTNRGAVPEGTACGKGQRCRQGECVPVDMASCPMGISRKICSGNGVSFH